MSPLPKVMLGSKMPVGSSGDIAAYGVPPVSEKCHRQPQCYSSNIPHRTPSQAARSRQLTPLLRSLSRSHLRRMSPQRRTYINHQPICMIITAGGRLQTSCANISTLYPCHAPTNTIAAVCGDSLQISAACKMKVLTGNVRMFSLVTKCSGPKPG